MKRGRERGIIRADMGKDRYEFGDMSRPHFLTCTVLNWLPVFMRPAAADAVVDSLRYLSENGVTIYAWVLMENHLHLVAQGARLDKDIMVFKSYTARQITALLEKSGEKEWLRQFASCQDRQRKERQYQLWQIGSHPVCIHGWDMMRSRAEYVHNNPVRRGYVDKAEDWRYSSARDYAGGKGLLKVCREW